MKVGSLIARSPPDDVKVLRFAPRFIRVDYPSLPIEMQRKLTLQALRLLKTVIKRNYVGQKFVMVLHSYPFEMKEPKWKSWYHAGFYVNALNKRLQQVVEGFAKSSSLEGRPVTTGVASTQSMVSYHQADLEFYPRIIHKGKKSLLELKSAVNFAKEAITTLPNEYQK